MVVVMVIFNAGTWGIGNQPKLPMCTAIGVHWTSLDNPTHVHLNIKVERLPVGEKLITSNDLIARESVAEPGTWLCPRTLLVGVMSKLKWHL